MTRPIDRSGAAWAAVALVCCVGTALGADQTLLGRRYSVRDPSIGLNPYRRTVRITAREKGSPNLLIGDPTSLDFGATLAVFYSGLVFHTLLPQGETPSGSPFWTGSAATQLQYNDSKGVNSSVTKVKIKRTTNGTFSVLIRMSGKQGYTPPVTTPGTTACAALTLGLGAGAERYSMLFGSESEFGGDGYHLYEAKNPTVEGVCPPVPCGASFYPHCGAGGCGAGQVCRPISGNPDTHDPTGDCACVAEGGPTDCPDGSAYLTGGDNIDTPLGCAPIPTCNDLHSVNDPSCSGGVPAGAACQRVRAIDASLGIDGWFCLAYPASEACESTCSLSSGGVCPSGQTCLAGSAAEGLDCGCFAGPYCGDTGACGGNCPDGTCVLCPPEVCSSYACICSSD